MFNPDELKQIKMQYDAYRASLPQKTAAAPKKKGNFLTSLIPSVGGIGGTAAGGAIGTAILPGVGTLAGALLGGALGGGAGKVAENKVEGNALGQGVAGEAALNGILGVGPLRLGKVGIDAVRGVKASGGLADALAQAASKAATSGGTVSKVRGAIANKGAQLEARAGGFGIGEKVPGANPLGFYDSGAISKNLKAEGIKPGSPENRLKQVEDALNTRGKQIDVHLTDNNAPLSVADKQKIVQKFLDSVDQQPGVDDLTRKKAAELASNFTRQSSDLKSLVKFRRGLDQQAINFNQNPSAAIVAKQLAARTFRDVLSETTNKLAPGIKQLNKSYSNLIHAKEFLTGGAKAVSDQSQHAGGGIIGRAITGDTAQAAKSRLGAALQGVAPKPANPFGIKAVSGRIASVGVPQALSEQLAQLSPTDQQSMGGTNPSIATPDLGITAQGTSNGVDVAAQSSPFSPQNVETSVKQIISNGGTLKDATNFLSLADAIQKMQAPTTQKLNAAQLQQANNANSGLSDLQTLAQTIQTDPSVLYKDALPGGGIARKVTGTQTYDAAKQNVVDVIARLRSGAAITADEAKRYMGLLPGAFDTPQTATAKLQRLTSLLSSFSNPQQPASDTTDLASALLAAQGQ